MMVVAWAGLGLIAFATLSPIDMRPDLGSAGIERFGAFAVMGLLFALAYPGRPLTVLAIIVLAAFGLEASQWLTPDRHGQAADAMIKFAGGMAGIGVAMLLNRMLAPPAMAGKPKPRDAA